jgi:exopolyphosphatase/guanosine-5'-triphosphate,3'-diphosphate pyrophosphatase
MEENPQRPGPSVALEAHAHRDAVRRAVIDVGTNSVKLLVADVAGRAVAPVLEKSEQTRLGSGFYKTHRLRPAAIAHTARVVAEFAGQARKLDAATVRVFATSAARDAINQSELLDAIARESGLRAKVISGDQEADWVFRGVSTDPTLAAQPLLILDVGGGSAEFIVGEGAHQHFGASFRLGTVRLLDQLVISDPPSESEWRICRDKIDQFIRDEIRPDLEPALREHAPRAVRLVGTGGTTSILARMDLGLDTFERKRIDALQLSHAQVRRHREHLWSLPISRRKMVKGLPADRADVILTGVAIYEAVMETFRFTDLRISARGPRFAAVMEE